MSERKRARAWVASLGVLALVVVACSGPGGTQAPGDPIKIGMLAQLSGPASFLGPSEEAAARIAVAEINDAGGLLGRQLEVEVCDDATDAEVSNQCARRLVNEQGVAALFAATTSASREAVIPVIEENGKTLYFYNAIYEGHSCSPNMWVFGTMPENQIFPVISYLQNSRGGNTWFFVGNDYNWPQNTLKVSQEAFAAEGSRLLGDRFVPIGTTDFTSILQEIANQKPAYVLLIVLPSDAVAFMKEFANLGLGSHTTVIATLVEESTLAAMGDAADGLLIPVGYHTSLDTPRNREFLETYAATLGADAPVQNFISMHTYDAVRTWALAVEAAGTTDHAEVSAKLPTVKFDSPAGQVTVDASTHHAFLPISLVEVDADGVGRVIHAFGSVDPGPQCTF